MGSYKAEDPLYLDCSYFVKHCYWKAGIDIKASNTDGLMKERDLSEIEKEELKTADIAVRYGHTMIFVGFTSGGEMVWAEMANHKEDGKVSSYTPTNNFKYKKYRSLD